MPNQPHRIEEQAESDNNNDVQAEPAGGHVKSRTNNPTAKQRQLDEDALERKKRKEAKQKKAQHVEEVQEAAHRCELARQQQKGKKKPPPPTSLVEEDGSDGDAFEEEEGEGADEEDNEEDDGETTPKKGKARRATHPIPIAMVHVETTVHAKKKPPIRRVDEPPSKPRKHGSSQSHPGSSRSVSPRESSQSLATDLFPEVNETPRQSPMPESSYTADDTILDEDALERLNEERKRQKRAKKLQVKRMADGSKKRDASSSNSTRRRSRSRERSRSRRSSTSETSSDRSSSRHHSKRPKRKHLPEDIREKKARPSLNRLHDEDQRTLASAAIPMFSALIATSTPYPTIEEQEQAVADAWEYAQEKKDRRTAISHDARIVISQRCSNVRSEVAQAARDVVPVVFGLGDAEGEDEVRAQQEKVADLREGGTKFLYSDTEKKALLFQNPALQKIVRKAFFPDARGVGIVFNKFFNPISIETLALVCTAVEHALDEYSTGIARKKKFSEQDHYTRYNMYLETLKAFGKACPGALRRILQEMHDTSRSQSGASAITNITNLATMGDITRAAAEYTAMGFGDE